MQQNRKVMVEKTFLGDTLYYLTHHHISLMLNVPDLEGELLGSVSSWQKLLQIHFSPLISQIGSPWVKV